MKCELLIKLEDIDADRIADIVALLRGADARSANGTRVDAWGAQQQRFLRAHPWVADLCASFVNHLGEVFPEAHVRQNSSTITIITPGGLQAGINLRTDGLLLTYWRGDRKTGRKDTRVRSPDDFESAVDYLRHLEPYHG